MMLEIWDPRRNHGEYPRRKQEKLDKSGDSSIDENFVKISGFAKKFDASWIKSRQVHGSCRIRHSVNVFIIGYSFLLLIVV